MLNDNDFMRYSRQVVLEDIGLEGQTKIQQARVLIIGLGGLGSPASLYLAGAHQAAAKVRGRRLAVRGMECRVKDHISGQ